MYDEKTKKNLETYISFLPSNKWLSFNYVEKGFWKFIKINYPESFEQVVRTKRPKMDEFIKECIEAGLKHQYNGCRSCGGEFMKKGV